MRQAVSSANRVGAKRLALFHHDPDHDDDHLDRLVAEAQAQSTVTEVGGAREGEVFEV